MHFTQPVDIKSWWSHNWKSAQVVNSDLVCDPQSGNRVLTSLVNSGLYWTVFAWNRDTAMPAEGNGDLQTLICVLVVRPRLCPTLLNFVPWQNWMAAYLGYTLWMKTLFRGWPIMVHDTHYEKKIALGRWYITFHWYWNYLAAFCLLFYIVLMNDWMIYGILLL